VSRGPRSGAPRAHTRLSYDRLLAVRQRHVHRRHGSRLPNLGKACQDLLAGSANVQCSAWVDLWRRPWLLRRENARYHRAGSCCSPGPVSDDRESNRDSESVAQALQVPWITAHDDVVAGRRSNDNGRIDHIGRARSSTRSASRSSTRLVEWLDAAPRQHTRHLSLRSTPPALCEDSRWNRRNDPALERTPVQGPDSSVVSLSCDERSGVVGQAAGHGSRCHSIGSAIDDRVGPGQLLVGQVAVFVLPCLNRSKTVFDDKSSPSSGAEPGGQAHAVALSSTRSSFSDRRVQSDRQLSYSHTIDGSTRFLPK
jgi:hypothetical protein